MSSAIGAASAHPYAHFEGSPQWNALDRALRVLADNHDLVETTRHEYVVGYLCHALAEPESKPTLEERLAALERLREHVRQSNLYGRDLVAELIAERRAEAALE